ncbi:hypothetical protein HK405_003133 [Cladochytrium tenue]|nr:hypothetical protein HK405_003133 [Cladochytrium tenue]
MQALPTQSPRALQLLQLLLPLQLLLAVTLLASCHMIVAHAAPAPAPTNVVDRVRASREQHRLNLITEVGTHHENTVALCDQHLQNCLHRDTSFAYDRYPGLNEGKCMDINAHCREKAGTAAAIQGKIGTYKVHKAKNRLQTVRETAAAQEQYRQDHHNNLLGDFGHTIREHVLDEMMGTLATALPPRRAPTTKALRALQPLLLLLPLLQLLAVLLLASSHTVVAQPEPSRGNVIDRVHASREQHRLNLITEVGTHHHNTVELCDQNMQNCLQRDNSFAYDRYPGLNEAKCRSINARCRETAGTAAEMKGKVRTYKVHKAKKRLEQVRKTVTAQEQYRQEHHNKVVNGAPGYSHSFLG